MFSEALLFLLNVIVQSFAAILLLRFHLQWLRAPLRNPVGEFVMVFTDFVVLRARRYIRAVRGYDSATLLAAWLTEMFYLACVMWIEGYAGSRFPLTGLMVLAAVKLLSLSLYLLMGAVLVQVVLSWVNPYSAISSVLDVATRRFLQPLRRVVPLLGSVDLSPMLLLIICQLMLILPVGMLERVAARLF